MDYEIKQKKFTMKFEIMYSKRLFLLVVLFCIIVGTQAQRTTIIRKEHHNLNKERTHKPKAIDDVNTFVQFSCDEKNAILYIDGIKMSKWRINKSEWNYSTTTHYVRVTAKGYKDFVICIPFTPQLTSYHIQLEKEHIQTKYINCKGIELCFKEVKGGTFTMGGTKNDINLSLNEIPSHPVLIEDFFIQQTEVTQELWYKVMGKYPEWRGGNNSDAPVSFVSWDECHEFIDKLSALTGYCFRLPTEAEWERAASDENLYLGNQTLYIDSIAWYSANSSNRLHVVASKYPNENGLYDMLGNVSEWCEDCYTEYVEDYQINPCNKRSTKGYCVRGGSWSDGIEACRPSARGHNARFNHIMQVGFRLVLQTEEQKSNILKSKRMEYVDLGLSICWAKSDFGASSEKYTGSDCLFSELKNTISELGEGWEVPTSSQLKELLRCKWEELQEGERKYFKVTGPNGNFIIINHIASNKGYWASDINSYNIPQALRLMFSARGGDSNIISPYIGGVASSEGHRIRPVCRKLVYRGEGKDRTINVKGFSFVMKHVTSKNELKSFYIGETEVTQQLWKLVMGKNKSQFKDDFYPVESISWYDCLKFIKKLNKLTGLNFRLPTFKEWQFAANGGLQSQNFKYSGDDNINNVGWHSGSYHFYSRSMGPHRVAKLAPNELAIYDMAGNVSEWCNDIYDNSNNTVYVCGGNWSLAPELCKNDCIRYAPADSRQSNIGFRLVLDE